MKNIKSIFFVLSVLVFSSCDNSLDLIPEDSLQPDQIFTTEAVSVNAVNGMYSSLQSSNVLSGIPDTMTEWQADNVEFVGSFPTFDEIYTYNTLSDNTSILNVWNATYFSINQSNMIILNVPTVADPTFSDASKNNLVGQARFVRALLYFKLSQMFGKQLKQDPTGNSLSVPLVTEPFQAVVNMPARATLKEVYTLIEKDLLFAQGAITNTTVKSRATSASATALLARLYLYQERWREAANSATTVINTSGISLAANYTFYNAASTEHIFQLQNIPGDQGFAESFSKLYSPTANGGRGDAPFSVNLKSAFAAEPGDLRYGLTRTGVDAKNRTSVFTTKYPNGLANTDDPNVLRVSEMYLIRAEANFRDNSAIGATPVSDLNRTRVRANLSPLATITSINDILVERRKEFCFEGLRRMDLLRNNLPLRSSNMVNFDKSQPNADKVVFPIPQRERDNNTNLTQNPGY
ncbi:RagB/SusD family nutrient uptake outer membrane protein [Flavobacterium sp. RSP15]|uniref:RagB/SusD family nutrient uptake outer membrane protein n=1 Tax=Flavobacterium sp. RSP15 TaxID=2497485 RepID=UPI000F81C179|nr:RagB/SusD family nutrient uptake outer membrane protein [Flavobacterium sp. RSP15]RTY86537.1 RagB/SusD family nutrient uptake outer membrane protein [Flavobacterium sp. RSP15]